MVLVASSTAAAAAASDELVEARLRVRHRGCLAERLPPGATLTHLGQDRRGDVFVLHAEAAEDLAAFLGAVAPHRPLVVARGARSVVFRLPDGSPCPLVQRMRDEHLLLWPVAYRDGAETHRVVAVDRAGLKRLLDGLPADAEVEILGTSGAHLDTLDLALPVGTIASDLTARQLEILAAALGAGYYRMPRRTSTVRLAAQFGIGRTTLEEHLRKAELAVLHRFGELLETHEQLVGSARKGRGRPRERA